MALSSDTLQSIMVVGAFAFVVGVFNTIFQANAGNVGSAILFGTAGLLGLAVTAWSAHKDTRS